MFDRATQFWHHGIGCYHYDGKRVRERNKAAKAFCWVDKTMLWLRVWRLIIGVMKIEQCPLNVLPNSDHSMASWLGILDGILAEFDKLTKFVFTVK